MKPHVWTRREENIIRKLYPAADKEEILSALKKRTWKAIHGRAEKLKIRRESPQHYTKRQLFLLRELYPTRSKTEIMECFPGRTWIGLQGEAIRMGMSRKHTYKFKNSNSLGVLLNDTPETLYWMGFLLADGSFDKNTIRLCVSVKDEEHVIRLKTYLKCSTSLYYASNDAVQLNASDSSIVPQIRKKWQIALHKTYYPPHTSMISKYTDEQILFILLGLIDGDGCISKERHMLITMSYEWCDVLHLCFDGAFRYLDVEYGTNIKKTKDGYAFFAIYKPNILKKLRNVALRRNIPILERKWNRLDGDTQ